MMQTRSSRRATTDVLMAALFEDIDTAVLDTSVPQTSNPPARTRKTKNSAAIPDQARAIERQAMLFVIHLARVYALTAKRGISDGELDSAQVGRTNKRTELVDITLKTSRQQIRYCQLAREKGWVILAICANSAKFREAAGQLDDLSWTAFMAKIQENARSLEFFAKVRRVPFATALKHNQEMSIKPICLTEMGELFRWKLPAKDHPHQWHLTLTGEPQMNKWKTLKQINIGTNIFDPGNFHEPLLKDPAIRIPADGLCLMCEGKRKCSCDPEDCRGKPGFPIILIELVDTPNKGVGVRALRDYKPNQYLGEYVGVHEDNEHPRRRERVAATGEWTYSMTFSTPGKGVMSTLSSHRYGNWTRYVNHSCRPNTRFVEWVAGQKCSISVQVIRDIKMFDEMTVDYGDGYLINGQMTCRCGEPECRFSGTPSENENEAKLRKQKERRKRKRMGD